MSGIKHHFPECATLPHLIYLIIPVVILKRLISVVCCLHNNVSSVYYEVFFGEPAFQNCESISPGSSVC